MARKKRQRISYVLPLDKKNEGHRLGINGLALDEQNSILYTGGRDGTICAWDLNLDLRNQGPTGSPTQSKSPSGSGGTQLRRHVQAHTHWVNDVVLAQQNSTLVSASSDVTVKVWRPHSSQKASAQTIGRHSDYVKCLSIPEPGSTWVASGGLDHKICLWDLNGGGERLQINVGKAEGVTKGSVYALRAKGSILASGGPESVVRIWDSKTGKSITKLVGHTDNVRDILISDDGDTVMSASSDQTVKIWSLTAGRCLHTLTMHNDSVWSLYSTHPQLALFYSSDRSGLVAKTDTRYVEEPGDGISLAVLQESDGVHKVLAAAGHIWTATSISSINRWADIDTQTEIEPLPSPSLLRVANGQTERQVPTRPLPVARPAGATGRIPYSAVLQLSITAPFPNRPGDSAPPTQSGPFGRPDGNMEAELNLNVPVRDQPVETVEGKNGLIKHVMLNDRKRVLTLDSTGEIVLWDLLKCMPINSFGKQHLEDIVAEVNTTESVANWCTVDTRTGRLAVALEENYCFDAEVYADETEVTDVDFREDQRINLGRWMIRNLFKAFIDEELRRDQAYRNDLMAKRHPETKSYKPPLSITMPAPLSSFDSESTPRANVPKTPGLSIGVATPGGVGTLSPTLKNLSPVQSRSSGEDTSNHRSSIDTRPADYFDARKSEESGHDRKSGETADKSLEDSTSPVDEKDEKDSKDKDDKEEKDEKDERKKGRFGMKFQIPFPTMKLGRTSNDNNKPTQPQDDQPETASSKSSEKDDLAIPGDTLLAIIHRLRRDYDAQQLAHPDHPLLEAIVPSPLDETPPLTQPAHTLVHVQEDDPEAGGVVDLYRGTIGGLAADADTIERVAPAWLGELLLRNQIPPKEPVKVSFTLQPYKDELPSIATADGNSRLNANRMLRAKKILTYVAERIEAPTALASQPQTETEAETVAKTMTETLPPPLPLRVEEYLELYCHDQLVPPHMTLLTLRTHVWRTGGDVALFYRANGRKVIVAAGPEHPLVVANGVPVPG